MTCVAITALKIRAKCALIAHKLRFFADFCLWFAASLTFIRDSLIVEALAGRARRPAWCFLSVLALEFEY